jgi:hypothetical protein
MAPRRRRTSSAPHRTPRGLIPWALAVALVGCDSLSVPAAPDAFTTPYSGPIVNPFEWRAVPNGVAPFGPPGPEQTACGDLAIGPEDLSGTWVYSVDTGDCNWHTMVQPTAVPMTPGDRLELRVWHSQLLADGPATAHVALAVEGEIWGMAEEPIPNIGRMVVVEMTVPSATAVGAEVAFRLDNHGVNSWHLVDLTLNP